MDTQNATFNAAKVASQAAFMAEHYARMATYSILDSSDLWCFAPEWTPTKQWTKKTRHWSASQGRWYGLSMYSDI
jgi:hypothetical protein